MASNKQCPTCIDITWFKTSRLKYDLSYMRSGCVNVEQDDAMHTTCIVAHLHCEYQSHPKV